jgi:hypothetical protein
MLGCYLEVSSDGTFIFWIWVPKLYNIESKSNFIPFGSLWLFNIAMGTISYGNHGLFGSMINMVNDV